MATITDHQPVTIRAIIIRIKAGNPAPKRLTKKAIALVMDELQKARVRRPSLEAFFFTNQFLTLPTLTQYQIDAGIYHDENGEDAYWILSEDSLGRLPKNGERDWESTAESIRLWIKRYFGGVLPTQCVSVTAVTISLD